MARCNRWSIRRRCRVVPGYISRPRCPIRAGRGRDGADALAQRAQVASRQIAATMPSHLGASQLHFDGVDDFVEIPPLPVQFTAGLTAEAWVRLENPWLDSVDRTIF